MNSIYLILILISYASCSSVITVYNQTFHYGNFKAIKINGCTNLVQEWRNEISAVDLHDQCFIFYSELNCRGKRVTLQSYHKKYTDNLNTIGFNDLAKSISECGFRIQPGPHILRSVSDGSVVSLTPMKDEFFANVIMRPWVKSKRQVWFIGRYGPRIGINYDLRPFQYDHYNPITYQTFEPRNQDKPFMPERYYDIKPLPGSKYIIKILHTDKCLINRGTGKPIGKTNCAPWMANQQFNFVPVAINQTSENGFDVQPVYPIPILL